MEEMEKLRLKKLLKELKEIKGRHTELISVYVPAGFNLVEIINQLNQEKSTAMNIKSKTTRKNVLDALEKITSHLKLFRQTPVNGLIIFCGNVSKVEGKTDIRLWSLEPPETMKQKFYWCDQVFVLEPLEEMVKEKEVYGLVVLDAREANIALLKGKTIEPLKHLESTVPSKTVKGGMCVDENTLIQLQDGNIIPIKELSKDKKILSYSFSNFEQIFTNSFEVSKRKANKSYKLILEEPSNSLILTPEHRVFVVGESGIVERTVDEIKAGDMLLSIAKLQTNGKDNPSIDKTLSQLLGYMLGDGAIDGNRIILHDKDMQLLKFYKKIAESALKKRAVILKRRNSYELRLYKKSFVDFILLNFPKISKPGRDKDIDERVLVLPKKKLRYFIRGLFDAKAYVDETGVGLRMANENIVRKIQLILLRYNIVASITGPDKSSRYELRITNPIYIENFKRKIGFSSSKKMGKLNSIAKKYRGESTRVPVSGVLIGKLIEKEGLKKEHFKKYGMFLLGKRNLGYPPFKRMLQKLEKKLKNKRTLELLNKICNSGIVATTLKEKIELKLDREFYDLYVPNLNSFVANGIVVHNSQKRYDRIREDAINEFLTKVGEMASKQFLEQKELKGVIIGGPGYIKELFFKESYLDYRIKNRVLGLKDTSYTGDYGVEELVGRSQDLLKEAAVAKEKELLGKFFLELQRGGNVVYKVEDVENALNMGAVDILLISDELDIELAGKLVEIAKKFGTKAEFISTDTREGIQFGKLSGIGAFLRYKIG